MFSDHATPARFATLKQVIAFFYGNGVPYGLGCQFYHACSRRKSSFIDEAFHGWYHVWRRSSSNYKPHMNDCYNKRLGKYINGLRLNQLELVLPKGLVMDFGIELTGYPRLIRSVLEHVR